jgi:hypothetical protein
MGAILFSAVFALAIPAGRAAQADDPPPGIYIYAISRDGTPVGQQRLDVVGDGEKLRVVSQMQMEVTLLGMTLFSFTQQAEEVRTGGNVLSLTSDADDDGKLRQVNLTLEGDRLRGTYNKDARRDIDPKWPTSLFWQKPATGATHVIDSVNGKLRDVTVTEIGPETLTLPVGRLEARHYRVTGELERDLWYDANGILVAGQRNGPDGSKVLLELQQRP